MTAAIYARFSSDLQTEKSIEDQVARCQGIAAKEGLGLCRVFSDHAISGASIGNRPGIQSLLSAIRSGQVTALVTESLDRLSRNQADLHTVVQTAQYRDVRLITASDGEILQGSQGEIMVGLRGIVGAMYLKDLGDKVRRGLEGVARSGRFPGGLSYGYRAVPGETRGLREIDDAEAEIVRRIYSEYDAGLSPRLIIQRLTAEGVPGPNGNAWGLSTVIGNAKRLNGILCNPLYKGELVFNRQRKVKNPETGKARMVPNPPEMWQRYDHPELAIVERDLWQRVHERRMAGAAVRPEYQRRPKRVLAGLVRCGVCGGSYRTVAQERYGCATRRDKAACSNNRTILAADLEARVFDGLKAQILSPSAVEYAVACYRERMVELEGEKARERAKIDKAIAEAESTIGLAKSHAMRGEMPPQWLYDAANEAERKLAALQARQEEIEDPGVVMLHPEAAGRYRNLVERLHSALDASIDSPSRAEAVAALRSLVTSINVLPGQNRGETHIEIEGDLAALLGIKESGRIVGAMGAGVGFEPTTFRL